MPITKSIKSSRRTTNLLTNAALALSVASNFGSLIPIPIVHSLIQTAQVIVATAQAVENNERSCAELARRSADLAKLITEDVHGRENVLDGGGRMALEKLNEVFQEVKTFIQKQKKLGVLGRIGKRGSTTLEVADLTAKLVFMMQMFQTITCLATGRTVNEMATDIAAAKSAAHNERRYDEGGEFRIIRRSDIQLLDKLVLANPGPLTASVEYYKARIGERAVTVLMNSTANLTTIIPFDKAGSVTYGFYDHLSSLKQLWHPNIVQLEGYSDTVSSGPKFLVLKGAFAPWWEYLAMLPTEEYELHRLRLWTEDFAAVQYLRRRRLWFANKENRTLMVDIATGRVVAGVDDVLRLNHTTNDDLIKVDRAHHYLSMLYQRYQSSCVGLSLETTLSEWENLYQHQLIRDEAELTYTCSETPLYTYAGLIMYHNRTKTEPSAFTFLDFLDFTIKPVLLDWPPTLYSVQSDETRLEISSLATSNHPVLDMASPANGMTRLCSHEYEAYCDWNDNQMMQCLDRKGYELYKSQDLMRLSKICIVYKTSFTFEAILHERNTSDQHQPVYLHISPMQNGRVPVPWAYFSFAQEPVPDGESTLMVRCAGNQGVCDRFISNLPGVNAEVFVRAHCNCSHLTAFHASVVVAIHDVFPPSKSPDDSLMTI